MGYKIIPGSQGNMFMVDVKRPGKEFQTAMLKEKLRSDARGLRCRTMCASRLGTKAEMEKFQTAFVKCMDMPPGAANGAAELHMPEFHIPSELYRGYFFQTRCLKPWRAIVGAFFDLLSRTSGRQR